MGVHMTDQEPKVKQIMLTPQEMQAAFQRASENVKRAAQWKDPRPPAKTEQREK